MNEILDFFIEPYKNSDFLDIALEATAAIFGILSVYYAKKEHILVFYTGIVSTVLYVLICYRFVLYGDLIVNIYYTLMSIYGLYMWHRTIDNKSNRLKISRTTNSDKLKAFGIFIFTSLFVIFVYRYYNVMPNSLNFRESLEFVSTNLGSGLLEDFRKITPFLDTFTTGIFFAAMWLMAHKKIAHWALWIVGNIVSIPLYFVKGLGFTGIQFTIFLILAFQGYLAWKKTLDNREVKEQTS